MSEASRDERELNTALEVHSPNWLPGARFELRFRRLWDKRAESFTQHAADIAGATREQLVERVDEDNDGFADLYLRSVSRASQRGDKVYRDALAALVGAALKDSAKIDTVSYLVDRILPLEPIHVRIISLLPFHTPLAAADAGHGLAKIFQEEFESVDPEQLSTSDRLRGRISRTTPLQNESHGISLVTLSKIVRADRAVVTICCEELVTARFLRVAGTDNTYDALQSATRFAATELGVLAGAFVNSIEKDSDPIER